MLIPLRTRPRAFQGPYMTCMMTAETYLVRHKNYQTLPHKSPTKPKVYDYARGSIWKNHYAFSVYFVFGLLSIILFLFFGILFLGLYVWIMLFIRFQYKFSIMLLLLRVHIVDFRTLNKMMILVLHIVMLIVGGCGYITLMFIVL